MDAKNATNEIQFNENKYTRFWAELGWTKEEFDAMIAARVLSDDDDDDEDDDFELLPESLIELDDDGFPIKVDKDDAVSDK